MFESKWRGINGNYVMRSNRELFYCYVHQEIVLCNNYVKACGRNGITAMYTLNHVIKHNMAESVDREMNDRIYQYPNNRLGKVAATISMPILPIILFM